jgi:hypothetical protein
VAPRAVRELFRVARESAGEWTYAMSFSMLEIYNECIFDLLPAAPGQQQQQQQQQQADARERLEVRQTGEGNVVAGLTEHQVCQCITHFLSV